MGAERFLRQALEEVLRMVITPFQIVVVAEAARDLPRGIPAVPQEATAAQDW